MLFYTGHALATRAHRLYLVFVTKLVSMPKLTPACTHPSASRTAKNVADNSLLKATGTSALIKCHFCPWVTPGWSIITQRE